MESKLTSGFSSSTISGKREILISRQGVPVFRVFAKDQNNALSRSVSDKDLALVREILDETDIAQFFTWVKNRIQGGLKPVCDLRFFSQKNWETPPESPLTKAEKQAFVALLACIKAPQASDSTTEW